MLGVKERLGHGEVRAGFDFRMKTLDFVFEIVGEVFSDEMNEAPHEDGCKSRVVHQAAEKLRTSRQVTPMPEISFNILALRETRSCGHRP